jgi:hypothetical protein
MPEEGGACQGKRGGSGKSTSQLKKKNKGTGGLVDPLSRYKAITSPYCKKKNLVLSRSIANALRLNVIFKRRRQSQWCWQPTRQRANG